MFKQAFLHPPGNGGAVTNRTWAVRCLRLRLSSSEIKRRQAPVPFPAVKQPMIPNLLSIAGLDPSGGAGIAAGLKTFAALGCNGMAAVTRSRRKIRKASRRSMCSLRILP